MTSLDIILRLRTHAFHFANEADLQSGIGSVLLRLGIEHQREVQIGEGRESRVDFLVGRVALEVKVGGGTAEVIRQLSRYAGSELVDEILLVTSRLRHRAQLPDSINGKPLFVMEIVRL